MSGAGFWRSTPIVSGALLSELDRMMPASVVGCKLIKA